MIENKLFLNSVFLVYFNTTEERNLIECSQ